MHAGRTFVHSHVCMSTGGEGLVSYQLRATFTLHFPTLFTLVRAHLEVESAVDLEVCVEQVGHHDNVYLWRVIGHSSSMGHGESLMKCDVWGGMGDQGLKAGCPGKSRRWFTP